jgi:ATP-dependent helicase/nuclease subunit B
MTTLYTIPFGYPFLETLMEGIIDRFKESPLLLAKTVVLLPTRRGCLGLKEAFQNRYQVQSPKQSPGQQQGQGQILPKIIALADLEQNPAVPGFMPPPLPPAMTATHQLGLLSQLILKKENTSIATALKLAKDLMTLLDEIHTSDSDLTKLQMVGGDQFAQHWQVTLDFLKIITDYWPAILQEYGMVDGAQRRRDNLRILAQHWKPDYPVILAGTTATRPATADLAKSILSFPQGQIVLPGYPLPWKSDEADGMEGMEGEDSPPTHPLYTLHQVVERLGIRHIHPWVAKKDSQSVRGTLLQQVMAPTILPSTPSFSAEEKQEISEALTLVQCLNAEHEALIIALKIRQALAEGIKSIIVMTPDVELTRRLQGQLNRWNIVANTSQGTPLAKTVVGTFFCLISQFRSNPTARGLLALLKHPLCYRHLNRGDHLYRVRQLDLTLRQRRPSTLLSSAFLKEEDRPWYQSFLEDLSLDRAEDRADHPKESLTIHLHRLCQVAEKLCSPEKLWTDADGTVAQDFFTDLESYGEAYPPLTSYEFRNLLPHLMQQVAVHDRKGIGSCVRLLGALEARQAHAPLMILAGLTEGTWPKTTTNDPWLNRQMRLDLGLPDPLRRIGLSAHDFCLGFSAPNVMLTHRLRQEGTTTIPSRWWLRLETLLSRHKIQVNRGEDLLSWAQALDAPRSISSAPEPTPCPPLANRPRHFSTTDIEQLMRDPFGYYARRILKLRHLDRPDQDLTARDFGNLIHASLDAYHRHYGSSLDLDHLLACGTQVFAPYIQDPTVKHFWGPRFVSIATWLVEEWRKRQPQQTETELKGMIECHYGGETPATIQSIADRIDLVEGKAVILDYKTGAYVTDRDILAGLSPQLVLEAILLANGAFPQIKTRQISQLEYWYLTGNADENKVRPLKNPEGLMNQAATGLAQLFHHFLNASTPYLCAPWGKSKLKNRDYLHLARFEEWGVGG